jgi:hypothetical protein
MLIIVFEFLNRIYLIFRHWGPTNVIQAKEIKNVWEALM